MSSPLERVREVYQKHLQLQEDDVLVFDFVLSMVAAVLCKYLSECVWAYLIAPPGACKTETVRAFQGSNHCVFLSSLTENCLMSGYRDDDGNDPSLIQVLDRKLLVVKDISSLINLPPRIVNKVWGDLRDAYDQTASKANGVTGVTDYRARFGALMLGTGALDVFAEEHQQLGERFLSFRMHRTPMGLEQRQQLALHVSRCMANKEVWQNEITTIVGQALSELYASSAEVNRIPQVGEAYNYTTTLIGNLIALLRTTPTRGRAESAELPTRIPQQLLNLGSAHAYCDGRVAWNESDLDLVRRVAVDTLPMSRSRMVKYLFGRGVHRPWSSLTQILERCKSSNINHVKQIMLQYAHSKIVEVDETGESYRLTQETYNALNHIDILKG